MINNNINNNIISLREDERTTLANDLILCKPPKWWLLLVRGLFTCVLRSLIGQPVVQILQEHTKKLLNPCKFLDIWKSWKNFVSRDASVTNSRKFNAQTASLRVINRPCLTFVISNMLRISSQSILRLIARFNPPRSHQRPFLESLYPINNSSTRGTRCKLCQWVR